MASLSHVFKAYDIRGVVPDELTALQFRAIGVAVARYNGLKLCQAGARPIGRDTGLTEIQATAEQLLDAWEADGPPDPDPTTLGALEHRSVLDAYADHVRSFVDLSVLRPLKVAADTANGMGGLVAPEVFAGLPFDVEILFPELDGNFPNHPADPIQP